MLLAQRWILARLRNRQFFSLEELNAAIRTLLTDLNRRPFKKLEGSRQSAFETIDRTALKPLPATRCEFAEWKTAIVNIDYHADHRPLPAAHRLVGESRCATATTVECFITEAGRAHLFRLRGRYTTIAEHPMPIASTCNGHQDDCSTGHSASVRLPVTWQAVDHRRIPSRATALASAYSTSPSTAARTPRSGRQRALPSVHPPAKHQPILDAKLDQHPSCSRPPFPTSPTPPSTPTCAGRITRSPNSEIEPYPTHARFIEPLEALRHGRRTVEQLPSAAHALAFEERFGLLVERVVVHRENRRLCRCSSLPQGTRLRRDLDAALGADRSRQIASLAVAIGFARGRMSSFTAPPAAARPSACALPACAKVCPRCICVRRVVRRTRLLSRRRQHRKRLAPSPRSILWSSTISPSHLSARANAMILELSMIVSATSRRHQPASPELARHIGVRRSPTQSSTGCYTMLTKSISKAKNRCANTPLQIITERLRNPKKLTERDRPV